MGTKIDTAHEGRTENDTVAELAAAAAVRPQIIKADDGRTFLLVPEGYKNQEITDPHGLVVSPPARTRQAVTIQTLDSLGEYVNRFKSETSVLFGDVANNAILAVIDYHAADKAAFGEHRARLALPFSLEWKIWTAIDGKLMPQGDFARFLEENATDIVAPAAADLIECCRDLQALRKVDFRKAVRTASYNESFEWTDDTQAVTRSGSIELPTRFLLNIPVYFGDSVTELTAFLRWAFVEGAGLQLGIALHRAEHVRQAVFQQHMLTVADRTNLPAVFGKPESSASW